MEGKEAIIAKIIADAENKAQEIVHAAETYAVSVKEQADAWAKNYSAEQENALKNEIAEMVARRKIVAELDVKKVVLKAKQDAIDEVYARAERKLCKADKKTYLSIVLQKIEEFADDGDEVVLSQDGVLSEKDISESEVFKNKKLSVSKTIGKFVGGVMLVGKVSDKNLTFNEIIRAEKEKNAPIIAKKLFG
ncbi:MAG: hypothetical protein J5911_01925 [Clostridia bacterium]|nr:hypothetical protein [Clostridia bacterium]